MKNLITNLKKPASLRALGFATLVFSIVAIVSLAITYTSFDVFMNDSVASELDNSEQLNEESEQMFVKFLVVFAVGTIATFAITLASMVFVYKKTYAQVKKLSHKPNDHANLVTVLYGIAGLIALALSYGIQYTVNLPHSGEGPESSALFYILDVIWILVVCTVVLGSVRFFAKRRAIKEKEELFS